MTHVSDRKLISVVLAAGSPALTEASVATEIESGLGRLAQDIVARGGFGGIEVGYCAGGHPSVEEAVEQAIARSAQWVIVVPTTFTLGAATLNTFLADLPRQVSEIQARHPAIVIRYAAPPFDHGREVDLILSKLREYEPEELKRGKLHLDDLGVDEIGVVRGLDGGSHFLSRMASLGFTPGVQVKMVQNYGHGAVIVSLRGTRVALGRGEAFKVGVVRETD